ncbi:MAG: hypothetical protein QW814_03680 [Methanothrix sp.]
MAVNIMEKNKFKFSSKFEANVAAALDLMGIGFSYKNLQFYISNNDEVITYTPDFILECVRNDKTTILETHGKRYIDKRFIEKMSSFKHNPVSANYHLILITDKMPKKPDKLKIELKKYKYSINDICDEVWYIPYNVVLGMQLKLKNEEGSIYGLLNKLKREEPIKHHTALLRKEREDSDKWRRVASKNIS